MVGTTLQKILPALIDPCAIVSCGITYISVFEYDENLVMTLNVERYKAFILS
jgi:hypothetical protein